jgi:hypothetical protein
MIRQSSRWLMVVIVGSLFVAGCGSGNSSTSSSGATASSTPASSTGTGTGTAGTASTSVGTTPSSVASSAAVAAAVSTCKSLIKAVPTLSTSAKAKVEAICNKAANGDLAGARQATKEVCVEVINASPIPSGPAKEHALAGCKAGR